MRVDGLGHARGDLAAQRGRAVLEVAEQDVGEGLAGERALAEEELVHEDAERVDVDAVVGGLAGEQLGGDVGGGAVDGAADGARTVAVEVAGEVLGDAEVDDLDVVLGAVEVGDDAVLGFDVAVDDAAGVGRGEGVADLQDHRAEPGPRERAAAREQGREVLAVEQLHRHVGEALGGEADVDDVDDVGVSHQRGGAGLLQEATDDVGLHGLVGVEDLDGELAADGDVLGEVDGGHAAVAEVLEDAVAVRDHGADRVVEAQGSGGQAVGRRGCGRDHRAPGS